MLYLYSRLESRLNSGPGSSSRTSSVQPHKVDGGASPAAEDEREVSRPVSPSAGGDGWMEVGKKQKVNAVRTTELKESSVSRIFGGKLRSVLRTPGQKDSVTLEPYQPLQLEISPPSVHTITDALSHLNEPEIIPGVWSASRNSNVDATKQVFVETLPPILILHFKRFFYDSVEQRVAKNAKPIAYGQELEIPAEIISPARRQQSMRKYKLFGGEFGVLFTPLPEHAKSWYHTDFPPAPTPFLTTVVYHHGNSATGGHYTACVQRVLPPTTPSITNPHPSSSPTYTWLHLDDESVEEVGIDQVIVSKEAALKGVAGEIGKSGREKCAYLAFYQRV